MLSARRRALRALLYAAAAGSVLLLFVWRAERSGQLAGEGLAPFARMIDGTAARPFVQRALLPALAGLLHDVIPVPAVTLALVLALGGFLALGFVLRRLVGVFLPEIDPRVADLAPAAGLLLLPAFFVPSSVHLYDPATLLLFALGLLLAARHRWNAFYAVLALAAINRETAFLLTVLFVVHERGRLTRARLALHAGAQVALFLAIQLALRARFAGNPGHDLQLLFPRNLPLLVQPRAALGFWPLAATLAALAAAGWRHAPRRLRQSLVVTLVPLAVGAALVGLPTETRVFFEAYPALFVMGVAGWRYTTRASASASAWA